MNISLSYVEGTSEKLRRILRSHKVRPTLYTESTLRKLFCKPNDQLATEDKKNFSNWNKLTLVIAKQSTSVNLNGL